MNKPKKIVIHCAVTPDAGDKFGASDIDRWHKERGWSGIGYHWVIRRTGVIEAGRLERVMPASVRGHNRDTLAICLMGTKRFNHKQYPALASLIRDKMKEYFIELGDVVGHYELAEKECPGLDMTLLRLWLKEVL